MSRFETRKNRLARGARAALVGPITSYPFREKTLNMRQAVEFIADVLYPHQHKRDARKRVRERIRYMQGLGRLPQSQSFAPAEFFTTVLDLFPEWSPLRSIEGLPMVTVVPVPGFAINVQLGRVRVVVDPPSAADLPREYDRVCWELEDCKEEILILKEKLAQAERQIEERREKDLEISRQRSMAGKRGGRPKVF